MADPTYRTYAPSLNTEPIEFLYDADEYYQDILESLKTITDTTLFLTGWVIRPATKMNNAGRTLEDVIVDVLKQPNGRCYILWNSNITGPAPHLMDDIESFRKRVAKRIAPAAIDQKLKIIISVDLSFDPGWKLSVANQASRLVPWGKPAQGTPWTSSLEKAQAWWESQFPKPSSKFKNLTQFTAGSHHQKTFTITGTKAGAKTLVGYCGIDISVGAGSFWHDGGMRAVSDMGLGLLENFVERWNWEIDNFANIVSYGVTATEKLDADTFFTEVGHANADAIATRRTIPVRVNAVGPLIMGRPSYILGQMAARVWLAEIRRDYLNYIADAETRLFIENQYFRHRDIAAAVKDSLDDHANLNVTIVVPAYSEEIGLRSDLPSLRREYVKASAAQRPAILVKAAALANTIDPFNKVTLLLQTRCLTDLVKHDRVKVWIPQRQQGKSFVGRPYIHTKLMVVDDVALYIGSANVNGRSLDGYADSEINLLLTDQTIVQRIAAKHRWAQEPDSENDPRYPKWTSTDTQPTYYAAHNLVRYTADHLAFDAVLSAFPKGKAAILTYWETFNKSKSKRVDTFTPSMSKAEVEAALDKLKNDMGIDLDTFDWGDFLINNTEHLL